MFRHALLIHTRALRSSARPVALRSVVRAQPILASAAAQRTQAAVARWYSETPKTSEAESQPEGSEGEAKPDCERGGATERAAPPEEVTPDGAETRHVDPAVAELSTKLEEKKKEAVAWRDQCLRAIADFRNLQDRTRREVAKSREFAITEFAKDLIDSVDNFDRALAMIPKERLDAARDKDDLKDLIQLYEGLRMTEDILLNTLKKHGLERVNPVGETFDPNEHEALFQTPQEGKEDNTIFHVEQKGFKLNGRVLRAAKVGIVKNK